jgi:hypothetical protein
MGCEHVLTGSATRAPSAAPDVEAKGALAIVIALRDASLHLGPPRSLWHVRIAELWGCPSVQGKWTGRATKCFPVGEMRYDLNAAEGVFTTTLSIFPPLRHRSKPARRAASSASAPHRAGRQSGHVRRGNPTWCQAGHSIEQ